jgi:hypothetical protein
MPISSCKARGKSYVSVQSALKPHGFHTLKAQFPSIPLCGQVRPVWFGRRTLPWRQDELVLADPFCATERCRMQ